MNTPSVRVTNFVAAIAVVVCFMPLHQRDQPVKLNFQFMLQTILHIYYVWHGVTELHGFCCVFLCACAGVCKCFGKWHVFCVLYLGSLSDSEMQIKCKQLPFTLTCTSSQYLYYIHNRTHSTRSTYKRGIGCIDDGRKIKKLSKRTLIFFSKNSRIEGIFSR